MRKLWTGMALLALAGGMVCADWKPEQEKQFEAWKAMPAAERYKVRSETRSCLLLSELMHPNWGKPSVAQCDAAIAVTEADVKAGVSGVTAFLKGAQRARSYSMAIVACRMLTEKPESLRPAEVAFAEARACAVKVKQEWVMEGALQTFYHRAWQLDHYAQEKRVTQYLSLCKLRRANLRLLFSPHILPKILDDPVTVRAGAVISAKTHAARADVLLKEGVIKLIVEANILEELSNEDTAAALGGVVKASWVRIQLDFPADEECKPAELKAKRALENAANIVASAREGILADM